MNRLVKVAVALGALGAVAAATIGAVRLNAPHGETVHVAEMRTAVVERGALAAGMRPTAMSKIQRAIDHYVLEGEGR